MTGRRVELSVRNNPLRRPYVSLNIMRIHWRKVRLLSFVPKVEAGGGSATFTRRSHTDVSAAAAGAAAAGAARGEAPLMDLHGRRHNYLRVSLTERCNLRCQYCMPAEGAPLSARAALLSRAELTRLLRVFVSLGVDKVRLTGGEPTLRKDLPDIIQELVGLGIRTVGLTTNGLVLTRQLPALQRAGLGALNVSLDSLRPDRYERMARRPGLARVLAGVDLALQLGYRPLKLNVVLIKGFNDDEICDFVELTRDREIEVRFIEFMPFSGNAWDDSKMVPYMAALRTIAARYSLAPEQMRAGDTARPWRVDGHAGAVAFIASMTRPFCGTCNRLRLTADGNLKVCLFGDAEVSLRDALRAGAADGELRALVRQGLANKKPQHAGTHTHTTRDKYAESRHHEEPADGAHRRLTAWGAGPGAWSPLGELQRGVGPGAWTPLVELQRVSGRGGVRAYSTQGGEDEEDSGPFTHLDAEGRARMVDVGKKPVTARSADAECSLVVGGRLLRLLRDARLPKGDALTVAQVAGVLGAKRTADLIPLCHPLPLDCVRVRVYLPQAADAGGGGSVRVTCSVRVTARTGAEMEALTGCAVAALALYDMCKSVDRGMRVTELRVVRKAGGARGDWPPPTPPPRPAPAPNAPAKDAPGTETYAPINFAHF